jgi:hypothetical protein
VTTSVAQPGATVERDQWQKFVLLPPAGGA